jgi:hypothetical protein
MMMMLLHRRFILQVNFFLMIMTLLVPRFPSMIFFYGPALFRASFLCESDLSTLPVWTLVVDLNVLEGTQASLILLILIFLLLWWRLDLFLGKRFTLGIQVNLGIFNFKVSLRSLNFICFRIKAGEKGVEKALPLTTFDFGLGWHLINKLAFHFFVEGIKRIEHTFQSFERTHLLLLNRDNFCGHWTLRINLLLRWLLAFAQTT